jgi:hypothetical protein
MSTTAESQIDTVMYQNDIASVAGSNGARGHSGRNRRQNSKDSTEVHDVIGSSWVDRSRRGNVGSAVGGRDGKKMNSHPLIYNDPRDLHAEEV